MDSLRYYQLEKLESGKLMSFHRLKNLKDQETSQLLNTHRQFSDLHRFT